jgi:hypothetical protein
MRPAILFALAAALAACSHEGQSLSGADKADPPGGAPHAPQAQANPHGVDPHAADPHAADPHAGLSAPPAAAQAPVAWSVPDGWKGGPSTRPMRVAEFEVGADESGAPVQCVVFGGIGGDDEQNLERWIGQLGETAKASAKTTRSEHDGLKFTRLEARGAYTDTMHPGGAKAMSEAAMLAAIVDGPAGKLHVKMVGPASVVDAAAPKFDAFLASMKAK